MRGFLFSDLLTNQHADILAQWLPHYCFLGKSLAAGHIPLWNPYQMAGMPYASDPQSGWLSLPAMALFTALPCGTALRLLIVFHPLLAGLGLYWFLRKEGLYRAPATAGGLSLALLIGASNVAVSLPFAGMLAWTPILLVGASGYLSARRLVAGLGWLALGAFAWGQVASAHMSHGLAMATLAVGVYLLARGAVSVRSGDRTALQAAGLTLGFLLFLPLSGLAVFVPRLDLIPGTSLRGGYAALGPHLARVAGIDERPLATTGLWTGWPLAMGSTPGAYAGAAILLSIPAALRTRGKRYLAAAFGVVGLVAYLLTLNLFVGSGWFQSLVLRMPFGDVYLHNPGRLRYLLVLVMPIVGAVGLQGLLERPLHRRPALYWLGGAAALFLLLPVALGAWPVRYLFLGVAILAWVPLLVRLGEGARRVRALLPALLAVELSLGAVYGQAYHGGTVYTGLEPDARDLGPLRWPNVAVEDYLRPERFVMIMDDGSGRFLTWDPPAAYFQKGYLFTQDPDYWPALENARGMLFEIPDALGYSPVQLSRYWSYVRATNPVTIFYNASVLQNPSLPDLRLLGVRYLITPSHVAPTIPARKIASEGRYALYEVDGYQPRVSVVPGWYEAPYQAVALLRVLQADFDPAGIAILESDPGIEREPAASTASPDGGGRATYREVWPEDVRITVDARAPSIVVIRNAWDRNWTATVDGRPAEVLRTDYFIQGVAVPVGRHEIRLAYRDPRVGQGLLLSALVWAGLLLALAAASVLGWRRSRRATDPSGNGRRRPRGVLVSRSPDDQALPTAPGPGPPPGRGPPAG
jgi:hypothetical protein